MDERRKELRHRTLKGGSIAFDRGGGCDCTIRNLSETGALLEVENLTGFPEGFTLFIRPENLKRSCAVAWRRGNRLGVLFVAQHAGVTEYDPAKACP